MKNKALLFTAASVFMLGACQNTPEASAEETENETMKYVEDTHTYAQPNEAVVTHLDLDIAVDFEAEKISGAATWNIKTNGEATEIIFDIYDLNIQSVTANGQPLEFSVGAFEEAHGKPLNIKISPETEQLTIAYETGADARALQWLEPSQTAGKKLPFLFTQSQAILARSWVPTQDSPGIRFTYDAKVKVPNSMLALMSANNPQQKNETGEYSFKMEQPIPSYLLALSVGDVVF